jgi:DNA repair exonuclease SbcCD ATPase subunit
VFILDSVIEISKIYALFRISRFLKKHIKGEIFLKEINQRKKLRKVKKKWVIVGTTVICGALTLTAFSASATIGSRELARRIARFGRAIEVFGLKEEEVPQDKISLFEKLGGNSSEDTKIKFAQTNAMNQAFEKGLYVLPYSISEALLSGGSGIPLTGQSTTTVQSLASPTLQSAQTEQTSAIQSNESVVLPESVVEVEPASAVTELVLLENLEKTEQLKETQAKMDELLKEQARRDAEIRALNETLGTQNERIAAREKSLSLQQEQLDVLKGKIELHKEESARLKTDIANTEQLISEIENELGIEKDPEKRKALEIRKRELQSRLKAQKSELEKISKKLAKETAEYNAKLAEYKANEAEIERLKAELAETEKQLGERKVMIDSSREKVEEQLEVYKGILSGKVKAVKTDVSWEGGTKVVTSHYTDVDGKKLTS